MADDNDNDENARPPRSPAPAPPAPKLRCEWAGCGAALSDGGLLHENLLVHTSGRELVCKWSGCDKQCPSRTTFLDHLRIHLPLECFPHPCHHKNCDFRGLTALELKVHFRLKKLLEPAKPKQRKRKADAVVETGEAEASSKKPRVNDDAASQPTTIGSKEAAAFADMKAEIEKQADEDVRAASIIASTYASVAATKLQNMRALFKNL